MAELDSEYGGLEEDFVNEVKDTLICHICTKPLRDPHLTVCCGRNFCQSCLDQWSKKHQKQCCPFCRTTGKDFQHVPDKKTKREINALKVRCSNSKKGCKWVGELGALKDHLDAGKDGCGYVAVACPNACKWNSQKVMRKDLQYHLKVECEERPYQCEHCGEKSTFIQITREHYKCCPDFPLDCPNRCGVMQIKRSTVDNHRKKCPLEKVCCPFEKVGCRVMGLQRKDEVEHMEKNVVNHQLLMLKSWDQRAAVIAKSVDSLLATCTNKQRLPLQSIRSVIDDSYCLKRDGASLSLEMMNFSKSRRSSDVWYSPPFYLGDITGLKLRLAVYPNGIKEGAGTHMSLVIECLERDLCEPKQMECGNVVNVMINNYYSICTEEFCDCKNSHEIWAYAKARGGLRREYTFVSHRHITWQLYYDTLRFQVKWMSTGDNICCCECHIDDDDDDDDDDES